MVHEVTAIHLDLDLYEQETETFNSFSTKKEKLKASERRHDFEQAFKGSSCLSIRTRESWET